MALTLADWLPFVQPHLGASLLPSHAFLQVEEVASRLPGTCLAALEMSLHDPHRGADLAVRLRAPSEARGLARSLSVPHVSTLLERWATEQGLRRWAPELWLELDLTRIARLPAEGLPPPVVCARLAPDLEPAWLSDELLPLLHGQPALPPAQHRAVVEALELLPDSGRPLYAFSLRSRSPASSGPSSMAPVRLEACGLSVEEMGLYLDRLAGSSTEASPELRLAIDELAPLIRCAGRNHLSLDLAPGVQPRLGVELSFARLPDREPGWTKLFDLLEDRGFLGPAGAGRAARRRAVFAWPGWDSFFTETERWPVRAGEGYCVRSLSHVKIVTGPERPPEAKVYLLFGLWRRPRAGSLRSAVVA